MVLSIFTGMSIIIGCMLFELIKMKLTLNEKQRLLKVRARSLRNAEEKARMNERNAIKILEINTKQSKLLNEISTIINSNKYNNETATINKIKDLTRNYNK